MERIFSTGALQRADREMRVSVGDIVTYGAVSRMGGRTIADVIALDVQVYAARGWDNLLNEKLSKTFGSATVYCWLFQGMLREDAERLHAGLLGDDGYLGAMEVSFVDPLQLQFFRNSLIERYRIGKGRLSEFYTMGENEDPDVAIRETAEAAGFEVLYEDSGARRTIFDDYDTVEHFKKVEDFKRSFSRFAGMSSERAASLTLALEELHPKLFEALAAAARTLDRADGDEELAQAALSGRRFMEQVADYLYPPRNEKVDGKKVGKAEYRNRLWAYLNEAIQPSSDIADRHFRRLGNEADRLVEEFNKGLHASLAKPELELRLSDLARWLAEVLDANPPRARKPYLAYSGSIKDFLR